MQTPQRQICSPQLRRQKKDGYERYFASSLFYLPVTQYTDNFTALQSRIMPTDNSKVPCPLTISESIIVSSWPILGILRQYCGFYLFGYLTSLLFVIPSEIPITTANPQLQSLNIPFCSITTLFALIFLLVPVLNYYQVYHFPAPMSSIIYPNLPD